VACPLRVQRIYFCSFSAFARFYTAWVINGPDDPEIRLPLFPRKRTQVGHRAMSGWCHNQTHAPQQSASIRSPRRHWSYSGNPAFRRPSINSFEVDSPRWATQADIVKAGSVSSRRAAASRASASRPRWAKAHAATSRLKSWSQGTCNRYRSRNLFAIANVPASFVSKAIF
jgi:hypothetical protein